MPLDAMPTQGHDLTRPSFRQRLRDFVPDPLHAPDAATVLSIYIFLLIVIPSDRGIVALGAAGSPAGLFSLGMLLWWVWHHLRGLRLKGRKTQPVRVALAVFGGCVLASYVASTQLALPYIDSNGATMNLLKIAGFAGVVLVANDGLRDRERFMVLLRRISWLGGLYALLGLVQFATDQNFVNLIDIPGLGSSGTGGVDSRGGFVRPESTARHTLEYASVLTVVLPIALTLAMHERSKSFAARWLPTTLLSLAAVLSVTRSALLGLAMVLLILVPTWEPKVRRIAFIIMAIGAAGLYVVVPGLAGTILGMFSGSDPSIDSRTSSYASIGGYLQISPWIGRGLGTMSADYRIFDNQYIGLLLELGVIGLLAFLCMILVAATGAIFRKKTGDRLLDALGPALGSALIAGALLSAFFDSLHFPQAIGCLALLTGLCGAYWNVAAAAARRDSSAGDGPETTRRGSGVRRVGAVFLHRWYVVLLLLALVLPFGLAARESQGVYYTKFDIIFQAPDGATKENALRTEVSSTVHYAALVQRLYANRHPAPDIRPVRAPLYGTGLRDDEAVYLPSSGGQWQTNFNKAQITVEIVKSNPEEAMQRADEITKEIQQLAKAPQAADGIWETSQITTDRVALTVPVGYVDVRRKYALAVLSVLAVGTSLGGTLAVDALVRKIDQLRARRKDAANA